jgi:hypothetical protein
LSFDERTGNGRSGLESQGSYDSLISTAIGVFHFFEQEHIPEHGMELWVGAGFLAPPGMAVEIPQIRLSEVLEGLEEGESVTNVLRTAYAEGSARTPEVAGTASTALGFGEDENSWAGLLRQPWGHTDAWRVEAI